MSLVLAVQVQVQVQVQVPGKFQAELFVTRSSVLPIPQLRAAPFR
jgi:hypothetical protein